MTQCFHIPLHSFVSEMQPLNPTQDLQLCDYYTFFFILFSMFDFIHNMSGYKLFKRRLFNRHVIVKYKKFYYKKRVYASLDSSRLSIGIVHLWGAKLNL